MPENKQNHMHPGALKSCLIPFTDQIFDWWYDDHLSVAEIRRRLKLAPPKVGIICVPAVGAQLITDILVSLGIKYLWNFANVCLKVPDNVIVQREVIAGGLAVLSAKIKKAESGERVTGEE